MGPSVSRENALSAKSISTVFISICTSVEQMAGAKNVILIKTANSQAHPRPTKIGYSVILDSLSMCARHVWISQKCAVNLTVTVATPNLLLNAIKT